MFFLKKKNKKQKIKKKKMDEEAELEWEREVEKNIKTFCANSNGATAIVVDGTVVRKQKGYVMITGNLNAHGGSVSTEIYDYTNGSVRKGPDMKVARWNHASVTLPTGDVAVFGGRTDTMNATELFSCELFNVKSLSFSEIGNMIEKRNRPAAVTLPTGVVLIIGGGNGYRWLNTCEFFNPADKKISPSKAKMSVGRVGHTASLLPNGKVLVCGGSAGYTLQTTEIYDPLTDSFSAGPLMTVTRDRHTATILLNGKILLTGGEDWKSSNSTELYDPTNNSFTAGPKMVVARNCHFSSLLPDGSVLIGGGETRQSKQTTEIYDPATNSFTKGLDLLEKRENAAASNF
jgi:hypothetical protein